MLSRRWLAVSSIVLERALTRPRRPHHVEDECLDSILQELIHEGLIICFERVAPQHSVALLDFVVFLAVLVASEVPHVGSAARRRIFCDDNLVAPDHQLKFPILLELL